MSAYHFRYFQNIQFKNHGIAPTPPYLPTLKAYPTPGVGGRFGIFSLKWRERMNLKVPGAILPLGSAILSTGATTVRGGWYNPPLRRTRVSIKNSFGFQTCAKYLQMFPHGSLYQNIAANNRMLCNSQKLPKTWESVKPLKMYKFISISVWNSILMITCEKYVQIFQIFSFSQIYQ